MVSGDRLKPMRRLKNANELEVDTGGLTEAVTGLDYLGEILNVG